MRRSELRVALPICALLLSGCDAGGDEHGTRLFLEEAHRIVGPSGVDIDGAAFSPSGEVVFWTSSQIFLWTPEEGGLHEFDLHAEDAQIAGAWYSGERLEYLDIGPDIALRRIERGLHESFPLPGLSVHNGTRTGCGWALQTYRDDAAQIALFHPGEGIAWVVPIEDGSEPNGSYEVTPPSNASDGILVGNRTPPFGGFKLDCSGVLEITVGGAEPPIITDSTGSGYRSNWLGLSLVELSDGSFVQTLADVMSDQRLLLLYGPRGRYLRRVRVPVPFGIIGSSPFLGLVLAAQRVAEQELVLYRLRPQNR